MESLKVKSLELQRQAHQLLFIEDDAPIYSDVFCRQNHTILALSDALFSLWSTSAALSPEEDAEICLSLLMGYNATIYDNGDKQTHIQQVLDRCWDVLDLLPASLLKARLLTYCYAEVYDEELSGEAHCIMNSWKHRDLTAEEQEVISLLENVEGNPYPWTEIEE